MNPYPIAYLFDMDGVIVDSNPTHKVALVQFCQERGIDLTEEDLKAKIYGRTNRDWITNVFGNIGEEKLAAYTHEKERLFRDLYRSTIAPVPGLISFLEEMDKQGIPRAIATSAPKENVSFTLEHTHTQKYFPVVLDDRSIQVGKPNPEIYLKSAAALKYAPEKCVVFEDSLSGVEAGLQAKAKVVGITTTHPAEELRHCHLVIDSFEKLDHQTILDLFKD
jgi:beta-phosphoglucomutase